jgi:ABC-type anion transport system duplicated permease subunit
LASPTGAAKWPSGGGWFFVTQSEAICVNKTDYVLPGLGSCVASAIGQQRLDQVGLALLTMLAIGAQWYVLFNATAGACAIPSDLREMAHGFQLRSWQKGRRFLLPAMFSTWITGAITACGAAWNASIVAELVTRGPSGCAPLVWALPSPRPMPKVNHLACCWVGW